jgi:hypothetical protein
MSFSLKRRIAAAVVPMVVTLVVIESVLAYAYAVAGS